MGAVATPLALPPTESLWQLSNSGRAAGFMLSQVHTHLHHTLVYRLAQQRVRPYRTLATTLPLSDNAERPANCTLIGMSRITLKPT